MNQTEVRLRINELKKVVEERLQGAPDEIRYKALLRELNLVDQEVARKWPLDREFAKNTRFGLFGVRELEDEPDLVDLLVSLDKAIKN